MHYIINIISFYAIVYLLMKVYINTKGTKLFNKKYKHKRSLT